MATTELKRYTIRPESWDDFLIVWQGIVKLRRRYGFGVVFAFADRETNMFTWAIDHEGDFDLAAKNYYSDPERIKLDRVVDYVSAHEIRRVEPMSLPG